VVRVCFRLHLSNLIWWSGFDICDEIVRIWRQFLLALFASEISQR